MLKVAMISSKGFHQPEESRIFSVLHEFSEAQTEPKLTWGVSSGPSKGTIFNAQQCKDSNKVLMAESDEHTRRKSLNASAWGQKCGLLVGIGESAYVFQNSS